MKKQFSFKLPVTIIKQGRSYVAFSPALDLSTSGKTEKQAKSRFAEATTLFIEEIFETGTASDVLSDLGWTKVQKMWNPPKIISAESMGIKIPAFA